jgi:hypothetical protein
LKLHCQAIGWKIMDKPMKVQKKKKKIRIKCEL